MRIYNYHPQTGIYLGESIADTSPLEPGKYLIPAFATSIEPPVILDGEQAVFISGIWELQDIPKPPEPPKTPELTLEQIKQQKLAALNAQYLPQLDNLIKAKSAADMRGQPTDAIKEQYNQLFNEFVQKKGDVIKNG